MNIAFDATAILAPMSKNRGIGNYNLAQFSEMIKRDKENHYFMFNVFEPFGLWNYPNLTEEYFACGRNLSLLKRNDGAFMGALIRRFIEKNQIDIFYITSPFDDLVPAYRKEWFEGVKVVSTLYDIIPYVFRKHYFAPDGKIPKWYQERIDMIRWTDKLLAISQSAKDDLISYLNFDKEHIEVIWGAPNDIFCKKEYSEVEKSALRQKFNLKEQFIICTGGDDERKNIAGLIEAYGRLPRNLIEKFGLAIVCKLQPASVERYTALAKKMKVEREVVLTNFVTDEELVQLYNMSSLAAFPSKYEGFGLPVVEAWACGKPVLTSNNSSLVQIGGDAATLVDAEKVEDIARGLVEALQDDKLESMAKRGEERLGKFQWTKVADAAIHSLKQLEPEIKCRNEKPRLAFFTPLPPLQSGISDYSVDILTVLANYFQVDVYIDDGYAPDCDIPQSICIFNHKVFSKNAKQYSHVLYQMGNSMFHYYMYSYLRKYGGILVLHDYNMHGVAQHIGLTIMKDDFKTYREYLSEDLPAAQVEHCIDELKHGRWPDRRVEINGFVVNYADKVIVHIDKEKEKLLHKDIGRTVKRIPLYMTVEPMVSVAEAKKALYINENQLVLAAFGHIHETKRAIPLLKAAVRAFREYENAIFIFVGKLDATIEKEFKQIQKSSGLSERIVVTGYTSLEKFYSYIDAADVCFNLRYPDNGGNSGVLNRILSRGKCVVVNDVNHFGELPDDACIKLAPVETMSSAEEEEQIYKTMRRMIEEPEIRLGIARRAREYAENEMNLEEVGREYAEFILSSTKNTIDEAMLRDLRENEITNNCYSDDEIRGIAKTLAYCIG